MTATFSVRRTQPTDAALLRRIRIASLVDAPYAFGARLQDVLAQPEQSFEELAQRHSTSETSTSFLLFDGPKLAGTVGAFFELSDSHRSFICALWVKPACRGTSAASILALKAVEWLLHRRVQDVFAWVANQNGKAWNFYHRLGFLPTSEIQPLPSDTSQLETLLRLRVAEAERAIERVQLLHGRFQKTRGA